MSEPIVVVSTAYNAERYVEECIRSVQRQTVRAERHYYVDARSEDRTASVALDLARTDATIQVILNRCRWPLLTNLIDVVYSLPPRTIVVWVDGDDSLATDTALERVRAEYESGEVWATYGSFRWSNGNTWQATPYADEVVATGSYRKDHWRASHLKTFRAGAFELVPGSYLREAGGKWFELCVDQAVMLPILELSRERAHFIPDVLYCYNFDHSWEARPDRDEAEMLRVLGEIRAKPPLARAWRW